MSETRIYHQYQEIPDPIISRKTSLIGYWFFYVLEFLMHHFFVLSSSTRIYQIAYYLLLGGTFYAAGSTALLGSAFFFGSIAISLSVSKFSHWLNHNEDSEVIKKQKRMFRVLLLKTEKEKKEEGLRSEAAQEISSSKEEKSQPEAEQWPSLRSLPNNYLNYESVANADSSHWIWKYLPGSKYRAYIYFMDLMLVTAACWNIAEEAVRWQAVLPISPFLLGVSSFTIWAVVMAFAAACVFFKNRYTRQVIDLRLRNTELIEKARMHFKKMIDKNLELKALVAKVEKFNFPGRVLEDVADSESKKDTPSFFASLIRFINTKEGALLGSVFLNSLFGYVLYIIAAASLSVYIPFYAAFVLCAASLLFSTTVTYRLWNLAISENSEWNRKKDIKKADAQTLRKEMQRNLLLSSQETKGERLEVRIQTLEEEKKEKLAKLAFTCGHKLKNIHEYEPQRTGFEKFMDVFLVPGWNTLVTIVPGLFLINGFCTNFFFLPSVLVSWPLFIIEIFPAIILAAYFGYQKYIDNKHDLQRDAAYQIIKEAELGFKECDLVSDAPSHRPLLAPKLQSVPGATSTHAVESNLIIEEEDEEEDSAPESQSCCCIC